MNSGPKPWKHPLPAIRLTETTGPTRKLARNLGWFLFLVVVFLGFTPWQQNIHGVGRVVAYAPQERQQTIEATVEGRVVSWMVQEGSEVKAGSQIGEISDYDPELPRRLQQEFKTVQQRIEAISTRIIALEDQTILAERSKEMAALAAEARVRMAEERVNAAKHNVEASSAAYETSRINYERQRALEQKGLASRRTFELSDLDSTQKRTDWERAQSSYKAALSEVEAIRADRHKILADSGAAVEKSRSELAKSREELQYAEAEKLKIETKSARQITQHIIAPQDGTIFRLVANPGAEVVKPGDAVAILIPSARQRAVELWVDGNDAPLIDAGRNVRLQFEGYPALQFSGWPETAVGTFGGIVSLVDSTDNGKGDFRVLILPDDKDQPWPDERFIRQGVRVNGWVLLNKVKLGYELWRNFNGFPPLIQPEKTSK
jgi:multidrug efflux pump subunit AcrA (membrane-fusion protein)